MSEIDGPNNPGDLSQRDSEQQIDEISFSYLASHPTIQGWKRKLYSLFAGESNETLFRLGSIEQYIRVLLAESKDRVADYCFREALSQIIQEWNPTVLEPANRLNNILSVVAAFTPAVGFTKILNYLDKSENVKRSGERVSDEYDLVDLYKKGLIALAQYYPTPPSHSYQDFGFLAYKQLLERNLKDERYSGYAAVRLLQLKVLDIKSEEFSSLFFSSANAGIEVFRYLIDLADEPGERQSVGEKLGDILLVCAQADNLEKFKALALLHNAHFNPEGDYQVFFPTLTFTDGTVLDILLDIEEVKETALEYYVKYTSVKVYELLTANILNKDKIRRYISGYLTQVISQPDALNKLVKELAGLNAQIRTSNNKFVITVLRQNYPKDIILNLEDTMQIKLLEWIHKRNYTVKTRYDFSRSSSGGNNF